MGKYDFSNDDSWRTQVQGEHHSEGRRAVVRPDHADAGRLSPGRRVQRVPADEARQCRERRLQSREILQARGSSCFFFFFLLFLFLGLVIRATEELFRSFKS